MTASVKRRLSEEKSIWRMADSMSVDKTEFSLSVLYAIRYQLRLPARYASRFTKDVLL